MLSTEIENKIEVCVKFEVTITIEVKVINETENKG